MNQKWEAAALSFWRMWSQGDFAQWRYREKTVLLQDSSPSRPWGARSPRLRTGQTHNDGGNSSSAPMPSAHPLPTPLISLSLSQHPDSWHPVLMCSYGVPHCSHKDKPHKREAVGGGSWPVLDDCRGGIYIKTYIFKKKKYQLIWHGVRKAERNSDLEGQRGRGKKNKSKSI